jgi:hypothetical protein
MDKRRLLALLAAMGFLVAVGAARLSAGTPKLSAVSKNASGVTALAARVDPRRTRSLRATAWHWQQVIGRHRSHFSAPLHTRRALRFWRREAHHMRRVAIHPRHKSGWLCIHRYEAGWRDSGDPYWGGLQMDRGFMRRYAPRVLLRRGLANRWTPLEQMWVAERAYRNGRGYYPWPNTARTCGLL